MHVNGLSTMGKREARPPGPRTVLMISRYFPPLYDIGGKRAYRFALHLPDHGWQPIILTGTVPAGYPADPTPLRLPSAVTLVRNYAPPWWRYRRLGLADGTRPEPIPNQTVGGVRRWLNAHTTLPLKRDILLAPRTALRARRLARSTPIDLVFATAPPWAVLAQGLAASRAIGAPLCLDLRDPWTVGFVHRGLARWVRFVERHAEAGLFARADRVIFSSTDTARAYGSRFATLPPQRFAVIPNSFDPALRPPPQPRGVRPTLVHLGNCYGPRTMGPVLHALAALHRRGMTSDLQLLNLGRVTESDLRLAETLGVRDCVAYRPMLPYAEAVRLLAGADLQLLLAFGEETGYVPAKFFDYLLSGAPILCVAPPSELTRLVEETGSGRCAAPNDVEAIADTIAAAVRRQPDGAIAQPNTDVIERFSAPNTAAQLARVFDAITSERGAPGR
jgi:glycosyl transferase family 4